MNDEDTLTPQDRQQVAQNQYYTRVQRRNCPTYSSNIKKKKKLKVKTKQDIQRLELPDLGEAQNRGGVKVFWYDHNPPPLTHIKSVQKGHNGNTETEYKLPKCIN